MMKLLLKFGLVSLVILAFAGCLPILALRGGLLACHMKQSYMAATSAPALKIPAGLDTADTTNGLHIPPLKEPAPPPRRGKQPCLDEPPAFKLPPKPVTPQA